MTYRLRLELDDSDPPIWRTLDVSSDLVLPQVFEALRTAVGWPGDLLHAFALPHGAATTVLSPPYRSWWRTGHDEGGVRLDEVLGAAGDALALIVVDASGDEWAHTVTLETVGAAPTRPVRCVAGGGACPPADSEGVVGYNIAVAQWHEGVAARLRFEAWPATHDPDVFDVAATQELLDLVVPGATPAAVPPSDRAALTDLFRRCVDDGRAALERLTAATSRPGDDTVPPGVTELVRPWRVLLEQVGRGASGGPGPVSDLVRRIDAAMGRSGADESVGGRLLRRGVGVGLLRIRRDAYVPTRVAGRLRADPEALWRHVAQRLTTHPRGVERDAAVVATLQVVAGRAEPSPQITARILRSAGHADDDEPLGAEGVEEATRPWWEVLEFTGGLVDGRVTAAGRALCRAAWWAGRPGGSYPDPRLGRRRR